MWAEFHSLVVLLLATSISTAVTVNFRNITFGSLADRLSFANQQKHQNQFDTPATANVIITTSSTTSTEVPVTVSASFSDTSVSNGQNGNRWCNVSVFKKHRVTWLTAYRTCKSLGNGTELASIKSQEDYNTFVTNVKDAGSPASVIYWTSGTDILDEGVFVWMSDGTEVTQTWWAPGQPDNHWDTEHCIAFKRYSSDKNYKMTDENCLLAGAFICVQPCKFWV